MRRRTPRAGGAFALVCGTAAVRHRPDAGVIAFSLQFIPVEIAPAPVAATLTATASEQAAPPDAQDIHVELTRGATQLCVRWPSGQAASCAAWPRELAAVALKD